jgi:hypothetical protein
MSRAMMPRGADGTSTHRERATDDPASARMVGQLASLTGRVSDLEELMRTEDARTHGFHHYATRRAVTLAEVPVYSVLREGSSPTRVLSTGTSAIAVTWPPMWEAGHRWVAFPSIDRATGDILRLDYAPMTDQRGAPYFEFSLL